MIKFISLEFLGLSHGIPGNIKNTIYSFEISALVPEIFVYIGNHMISSAIWNK